MKGLPVTRAAFMRFFLAPLILLSCLSLGVYSQTAGVNPAKTAQGSAYLGDAKSKLTRGDLAGAEALLWNILAANPNDEQALTMLGVIRGRQKRVSEAEALFRRVLQLNPQSAVARRDLGSALVAQDKIDEALEEFREAETLDPHDYQLKVQLAQLYATKGQFSEALSKLQAIPAAKVPVEALPLKAASFVGLGRPAEAELLIPLASSSAGAELDLAEIFINAKLPDQALRCLTLVGDPAKRRTSRYYALRGKALQLKGDVTSALRAYREGLKFDPQSPELLADVAAVEAGQRNHAEALAQLKQARAANPDSLAILRQLVVEAVRAGDHSAALDAASALSEKSSAPEDLYLAGAALLELNSSGAAPLLERYVAAEPKDGKGWLGLGIAYANDKRYADAHRALERSLQLEPDSAEANYELGIVAKSEGDVPRAMAYLQRAIEIQPRHANALLNLGNLYLQAGELQKARDMLQAAEAINPRNVETEYNLGLVYSRLGQSELAKQHMEEYRKLKEAEVPAVQEHK